MGSNDWYHCSNGHLCHHWTDHPRYLVMSLEWAQTIIFIFTPFFFMLLLADTDDDGDDDDLGGGTMVPVYTPS